MLTAAILVHGTDGGAGAGIWNGTLTWGSDAGVNGYLVSNIYTLNGNQSRGFSSSGSNNFGLQFITAPVSFGNSNSVRLHVFAKAAATAFHYSTGFSEFNVDLGNTVSWQGITNLTVRGVAVTDYSAISADTGFDFRRGFGATVPEPASWALMIAGFGVTGSALRRRAATVRVSYS